MDRLAYVQSYGHGEGTKFDRRVYKALVYCLSREDTCLLFEPCFQMYGERREVVLEKIVSDASKEVCECHSIVVDAVLAQFLGTTGFPRSQARLSLYSLYDIANKEQQSQIILHFLKSDGRLPRRNAYRILERGECEQYFPLIIEAWHKYKDIECAEVMALHFPDTFIAENAAILRNALLYEKRSLKALFTRLSRINNDAFNLLLDSDPVTYLYLCTILKRHVSEETAWDVYHFYRMQPGWVYKDLTGLIIWCLGQLGLWNVILKVQHDLGQVKSYDDEDAFET